MCGNGTLGLFSGSAEGPPRVGPDDGVMTTTLVIALNAAFAVGIIALLTFVMTRAMKLQDTPDATRNEQPAQLRRVRGT